MYQYRHLFITDDSQLQIANLPPLHIPLLHKKPLRSKPYRLAPEMEVELKQHIEELRKAGIVSECFSVVFADILGEETCTQDSTQF